MISKIFRLLNAIIINNVKFILIKLFHFKRFKFKFINFISPFNSIDIQNYGKIELGKKLNFLYGNVIGVRNNGYLKIDDGTFLNHNCQIIAHKKIQIGKNVCIGPNTIIVDHDHFFSKSDGVDKKRFNTKEVIIGDNVWIGANCVILKGTVIENNSVIGAGSIVSGHIQKESILIQKRENVIRTIK